MFSLFPVIKHDFEDNKSDSGNINSVFVMQQNEHLLNLFNWICVQVLFL